MKGAFGHSGIAACICSVLLTSDPAAAQENRLAIGVRMVQGYETNALRLGQLRADVRGNFSSTPAATIDLQRNFARQQVFVRGAAGYVFNSEYKFLDREEIDLTTGGKLRFGPRCQIDPTATYFRAQSDLEDLGANVRNTVEVLDYAVTATCPRPAGFYPTVTASYNEVNNSERRRERDQSTKDGRVGLIYRRPSIGDIELFAQFAQITRNRRFPTAAGATQDETDIKSVSLRFHRDVGTRVGADVQFGYSDADPSAPGVPGFSGLTYRGALNYNPAPRLGFAANIGRAISGRGNVGTSYYIIRNAEFSVRAKVSARTSVGAGIDYSRRTFRGEDAVFVGGPRGTDKVLNARANLGYGFARHVGLDFAARYRRRTAQNDFYDYDDFIGTVSVSVKLY